MKGSAITTSVALCVLAAFAEARTGGLRPGARNLQTATNFKEVYFSEMLAADESVVILEDGPIKLVASCKEIDYDLDFYYSSSSFSNTPSSYSSMGGNYSSSSGIFYEGSSPYSQQMTRSSSASHYFPYSSGSTSTECYNPCGSYPSSTSHPWGPTSSGTFSYSYDYGDYTPSPTMAYGSENPKSDDYMSDDYYWDYSYMWYDYTESIAALELTYTAMGADYLYGSPSYANYPNETVLVGAYEAGETRTQTIFAGRDGGYGDVSTLQSIKGGYISTGYGTVGIHKEWVEYLPGGMESFPEGVECMLAGVVTYYTPEDS